MDHQINIPEGCPLAHLLTKLAYQVLEVVNTDSIFFYSPISGYIKANNINIGKYVAPTDVQL